MANLIRTKRTYKTAANAELALEALLARRGKTLQDARYVIAVAPDGRFAPALVGVEYIGFIHDGITVIG